MFGSTENHSVKGSLSYLFIIWRTFFRRKQAFVKQKGSSDIKGSLWNHVGSSMASWSTFIFKSVWRFSCINFTPLNAAAIAVFQFHASKCGCQAFNWDEEICITPILASLHWLPVKFRIRYMLLLFVASCSQVSIKIKTCHSWCF